MGCCKRCGSNKTKTELLIPTQKLERLKGKEFEQPVEIFCKECGKINRTKIKTKLK